MIPEEKDIPVRIKKAIIPSYKKRLVVAGWLQTTLKKIRKREKSAKAVNYEKVLNHIAAIPLLELESHKAVLRGLMQGATNPVDKATYKRLYRKARNVIEYRKECLK